MNEKRVRRVVTLAKKLRKTHLHLDEAERLVLACFLEGTPDERWANNVRYCQYMRSYEAGQKIRFR